MSHNPTRFKLPYTLQSWPWKRLLDLHLQEVKDESAAWLRSFKAFEPRQQRKFDLCDFSKLSIDFKNPLLIYREGDEAWERVAWE